MLRRKYRFIRPSSEYRELAILTGIALNSRASQRSLAREASLSVAVLHEYVDDLTSRGLVEVEEENARSYRYRLSPLGEARRDELFFAVSREVIQFYGQVKSEFRRRLEDHVASGVRRVVLFGAAETGELVWAASRGTGLEVVGIVDSDPARQGRRLGDLTIEPPASIPAHAPDAVIITSFGHMDEIHDQLRPLEERGLRVLRL
ncbi:MAG: winged helix-turn-helix transcriptional regulator [Planctomycetes bacterium]|nr:winged helix-turn-helix transcriptional regulator [Planctomycetota bacterium]